MVRAVRKERIWVTSSLLGTVGESSRLCMWNTYITAVFQLYHEGR